MFSKFSGFSQNVQISDCTLTHPHHMQLGLLSIIPVHVISIVPEYQSGYMSSLII